MNVPKLDSPEDQIKKWLNHIAVICLSEEFQQLKNELEDIYSKAEVQNGKITAFQDALYAFLSQEEDYRLMRSGAFF